MLKRISFFLVVLFCFVCFSAGAEVIEQTFEHKLNVGTSAQSWEHRIDLPENLQAKNQLFIKRSLELTDKLVIEREELTGSYYYIKVRLPKAWLFYAKGSVKVTLTTGTTPSTSVPSSPTGLKVSGKALTPDFSWTGGSVFSAISLMERESGKTVWERVLIGKTSQDLDEGSLKGNMRYMWAVKQSGENAKYSSEANAAFRIDIREDSCRYCRGTGYVTCTRCNGSGGIIVSGPNGPVYQTCNQCMGTGRERCTFCNGTGVIHTPIIVTE
ncbi:MAG: hypothetical protein HQM10_20610 [Candidatus Riflebacteria bacterium]|nr:hypothetical protein [Candidatus Riflebacteria bacterium]